MSKILKMRNLLWSSRTFGNTCETSVPNQAVLSIETTYGRFGCHETSNRTIYTIFKIRRRLSFLVNNNPLAKGNRYWHVKKEYQILTFAYSSLSRKSAMFTANIFGRHSANSDEARRLEPNGCAVWLSRWCVDNVVDVRIGLNRHAVYGATADDKTIPLKITPLNSWLLTNYELREFYEFPAAEVFCFQIREI